ncbi:patatin-like phospholipase family protein [Acinetobacter sp. MD2(2019)]|uniref:patatin-like phospholipase family protein n=1 Tax=Acinetobacter sp. MD2(2019) TaxID=2605273 RepID=UPI002D1F80BE|nr:patatin-like phospholipase family protein [Acinetobacter sp. MD2(2019)]MEB3753380.1 patatin-like phospholipase family protein [Acinetobacter sp. MD2(2019)]
MKKWMVAAACSFFVLNSLGLSTASAAQPDAVAQSAVLDNATEQPNHIDFKSIHEKQHRPVVALVLGSGGARGYAHIGAIDVLEKNGIHPDFIVGTSAGSIAGALYASGKTAEQMKDIALNMKVNDVREFKIRKKGFLDGQKVQDFINEQVNNLPLEKMKIPLFVVATQLKTGKKVVFNYGNTGQAVSASAAIPSMFIPANIAGQEYVDGGLVSPVPVEVARQLGADVVIAVDILAQPKYTVTDNIWGLFNQNINIMQQHLSQVELQQADVVIRPDIREKAHIFDVKERANTMLAGEVASQAKINSIKHILQERSNAFAFKNSSNELANVSKTSNQPNE